jgi:hypothetical protein
MLGREHYQAIESLFERLLPLLEFTFSKSQISDVKHFFDHGEYGLALDTCVGVFLEEKTHLTADIFQLLESLASLMEYRTADFQRLSIEK